MGQLAGVLKGMQKIAFPHTKEAVLFKFKMTTGEDEEHRQLYGRTTRPGNQAQIPPSEKSLGRQERVPPPPPHFTVLHCVCINKNSGTELTGCQDSASQATVPKHHFNFVAFLYLSLSLHPPHLTSPFFVSPWSS